MLGFLGISGNKQPTTVPVPYLCK